MASPLNLNPFGDTNNGLIGQLNNSIGLKAIAPAVAPVSNSISSNMSVAPAPSNAIGSKVGGGYILGSDSSSSGSNQTSTSTADIQSKLGISSDGIYGPQTTAAVKAYQQANGLTADGIVGPQTLAKLMGGTASSSNNTNTSGTASTGNANDSSGILPTLANANTASGSGPYTPPNQGTTGVNQGGLIGNLVNQSSGPSQAYTDAQTAYQTAVQNLASYKQQLAATNKNISAEGISLDSAQGQEANIGQAASSTLDALQQAVTSASNVLSAANTQQGLEVQAGQAAGQLNQPTGNIINVSPVTGLPIAGGSLGQLASTAGQVQGIQSGAAAQAAAGGNIAAQNQTALGTAATGANAQSIANFTGQINTTQKSVQTLNNLAGQIIPGMGTTGFNPENTPVGNQTFGQYFANSNPSANAGLKEGLAEIQNQISNVISSSTGLTPSGVTSAVNSFDFTTLSPQQLNDFLQYINQYAQSNINAAQGTINVINGGGVPSTTQGALPAPTPNSVGLAATATGATLAAGLVSKVLSEVGNTVSGAAAGAAASIFK